MRNIAALFVVGCALLGVGQAIGSDREDALEILSKAIKAHGGEEGLAKASQFTRKGSGTITLFDKDYPFTDEWVVALPDRVRFTTDMTVDKQKIHATLVINGDMGWRDNGGVVEELPKELLPEPQHEAYALWVSLLVPLKKDTEFSLTPLAPVKVNDRAVVGIKVARKSRPTVSLYFDAETGLLARTQLKTTASGVDVVKEFSFSEYKEVDGVKLPFHLLTMLNDKKFTELKVAGYKLGKPDDKLFGKP